MATLVSITVLAVLAWVSLWYAAAAELGDASIADTAWGLGGGVFVPLVGLATVGSLGPRSSGCLLVAAAWGVRLAWHVERRRQRTGGDRRYRELVATWGENWRLSMFAKVFLTQGLVLVVVTLPLQAVLADDGRNHVDAWLIVGLLVAVAGLALEVIADRQLAAYVATPKSQRSDVLDSGTWSWCRHPNYLGEAMLWWGLGIAALPTHGGLIALLGPLVINYTLRFGTGVPTVEEHRRTQPAFQAYMRRVPAMLPLGRFHKGERPPATSNGSPEA